MSDIHKVLGAFDGVKPVRGKANKWVALCPGHDDKKRSLSISFLAAEDRILLHCFAGCEISKILSAAGLEMSDIQPMKAKKPLKQWQRDLEAEYKYFDANGEYLYSKLRYTGKKILYARTSDKYMSGRGDANKTLYRLPELLKAIKRGKTVFVVEGEKDADNLARIGLTATTCGATGDWDEKYSKYFIGADVVMLPDNDDPGRKLMDKINRDLASVAFKRRTILISSKEKGDVSDWLEEDHNKDDLLNLVRGEDPEYPPWYVNEGRKHKVNVGLLAEEILSRNFFIVARNPGFDSDITYRFCDGVYRPMSDAEIVSIVKPYLPANISNPTTLKNVSTMIRYGAEPHEFDDLNQQETYINLQNGLFNIETESLEKHSSNVLTTTQLSCEYVSGATSTLWETFINDLCTDYDGNLDEQMIRVIQEWSGLIVSPIHGYRVKKALVLFSSEGNTGKSVYLSVLSSIIGLKNVANISFQEMGSDNGAGRWASGRAYGKRLLAIGDQGAEAIESSSSFKMKTGGDLESAEMKGKQGFDYKFTGVVVAACNVLPVFNDDKGQHMADRLQFLHCRNVIDKSERDPLLVDKLRDEAEGIFLWALKGLRRLIDNGFKFSECESSDRLMTNYRKRYDTLYSFITDECFFSGESVDYVRKTDFEQRYLTYCASEGFTPLSKRNIASRAASLGVRLGSSQGFSVYRGIRFLNLGEKNG